MPLPRGRHYPFEYIRRHHNEIADQYRQNTIEMLTVMRIILIYVEMKSNDTNDALDAADAILENQRGHLLEKVAEAEERATYWERIRRVGGEGAGAEEENRGFGCKVWVD